MRRQLSLSDNRMRSCTIWTHNRSAIWTTVCSSGRNHPKEAGGDWCSTYTLFSSCTSHFMFSIVIFKKLKSSSISLNNWCEIYHSFELPLLQYSTMPRMVWAKCCRDPTLTYPSTGKQLQDFSLQRQFLFGIYFVLRLLSSVCILSSRIETCLYNLIWYLMLPNLTLPREYHFFMSTLTFSVTSWASSPQTYVC